MAYTYVCKNMQCTLHHPKGPLHIEPWESDCVLSERGKNLFMKGDFEGAYYLFEQARKRNDKHPFHYINRALALMKLGQWQDAIISCRYALLLRPGIAKAHQFLGHSLCEFGKLEEGIMEMKKGVELAAQQGLKYSGDAFQVVKEWGAKYKAMKEAEQAAEQAAEQQAKEELMMMKAYFEARNMVFWNFMWVATQDLGPPWDEVHRSIL